MNNSLRLKQLDLNKKHTDLNNAIILIENNYKMAFDQKLMLLDAYSPLKVLSRGYAITSHNGLNVSSIEEVNINDKISIRLNDGTLDAKVMNKEKFNG